MHTLVFADTDYLEVPLVDDFPPEAEEGGDGEGEEEETEVGLEDETDTAQGVNDSKKTPIRR